MRPSNRLRLFQRLTEIRAVEKDRAANVLAAANLEAKQADEALSAASARLETAKADWQRLQELPALDLAMCRLGSAWVLACSSKLAERDAAAKAARSLSDERRSLLLAALAREDVVAGLRKAAARGARRQIDEAALSAAEERHSRRIGQCE